MKYAIQMFRQFFFFTYPGFLFRTASQMKIAENYVPRQILTMLHVQGGDDIVYLATMIIFIAVSGFIMTRRNTKEIVESTDFGIKTR